jgi:hypothetical protein
MPFKKGEVAMYVPEQRLVKVFRPLADAMRGDAVAARYDVLNRLDNSDPNVVEFGKFPSTVWADDLLKPQKPSKKLGGDTTYLSKYPWSSDLLEKFKNELPKTLKVDEETSVTALLVNLGVWTQTDADLHASYDHQKRLLRQAMYEVGATSSHSGYMFAVSEDAKSRSKNLKSQLHGV